MAAARTDQAPGRVGRHPAIMLPVVPLAVFRPEYPLPALHVLDGEGAHILAEGGRIHASTLPGGDELEVPHLGRGERFDCHQAFRVAGGFVPVTAVL